MMARVVVIQRPVVREHQPLSESNIASLKEIVRQLRSSFELGHILLIAPAIGFRDEAAKILAEELGIQDDNHHFWMNNCELLPLCYTTFICVNAASDPSEKGEFDTIILLTNRNTSMRTSFDSVLSLGVQ